MEDKNVELSEFAYNQRLKIERKLFAGRLLGSAVGYLLITLLLNSIRATASLWVVWPLIIIQFTLYFAIFITSYSRSKALSINAVLSLIVFTALAVLGRVNDWELVVLPVTVVAMLILSAIKKQPK